MTRLFIDGKEVALQDGFELDFIRRIHSLLAMVTTRMIWILI